MVHENLYKMKPWIDWMNRCNKFDVHNLIGGTIMQEPRLFGANSPVVYIVQISLS